MPYDMGDLMPYLVGCAFAIVGGHIGTASLVDRLWISIGARPKCWKQERPDEWWLPIIVGLVERALYVGFLTSQVPALIGVWLALKVVNKWHPWEKGLKEGANQSFLTVDTNTTGRHLSGSSIFSIFVIGNGVSIGYALVGSYLIGEWKKSYQESLLLMLITLAATLCLSLIAFCFSRVAKYN
ncbi:MAG: hypothetical protein WCS42_16780 [Verrucomicrobiota bacterium]